MSVIDVLERAEGTLADENEPFQFTNWATCGCGHVYHAVTGVYTTFSARAGWYEDSPSSIEYRNALRAILRAHDESPDLDPAGALSLLVGMEGNSDQSRRAFTLELVRKALARERYKAIIDAAAYPDTVLLIHEWMDARIKQRKEHRQLQYR